MKVIELQAREGIGSLVIGERAKPEPGPGEILVRIKAVTLNYRDLAIVQGTGGVSIFALQLARSAGASVIATTSSNDKVRRAKALGATEVINYREHADWQQRVMSLTDGRGADHVIDVVGGTNIDRSIGATRIGGTVSLIGFLEDTQGVFNLPEAFRRVVTLNCISVGSRSAFEALVAATEAQQLKPVISRVFSFDEIHNAFKYLASGTHLGKIAIEFA